MYYNANKRGMKNLFVIILSVDLFAADLFVICARTLISTNIKSYRK